LDYIIVLILITLSGLFSGLTIGLMGLSKTEIIRQRDLGNEEAKAVLPVVEDSNLLLVTLLLGNTAVNSTLAIFLGALVGAGVVAGIVSTLLIMVFGEILPASIISKNPLKVGNALAPAVKLLIKVLYPFTKPIAMLLDKYVGKEGIVIVSRREIIHMVEQMHESNESDVDELDKKMVGGAVLLSEKKVGDHQSIKPFTLNSDTIIDQDMINTIKEEGYTRIPVIENSDAIGILNVKNLIGVDFSKSHNIMEFVKTTKVMNVDTEETLDDVLNHMVKEHKHIAIVKSYETIVGVITLEDILEEVLLTEIIDEFDDESEATKRVDNLITQNHVESI
jgi:metal transporter CNNM